MNMMSDTASAAAANSNVPELSVSELAQAVRRAMETNFDRVRVRGELGRVLIAKSGHLYVDLKDADACIATVMWRANVQLLNFKPEEGLEVVAEGRLVNRLDRETSGVLLLCETADVAARLGRAFERGAVDKEYVAVVRGEVAGDAGSIDLPIGPARASRVRVRLEAGHGKPARTDWTVLGRPAGRTVLRLVPRSGRRHQIRVHLEAIGHPVLGDPLYGRPDDDYLRMAAGERVERFGVARQMLHCARLRFPDPAGPAYVSVAAPLPDDLRAAAGLTPPRATRSVRGT